MDRKSTDRRLNPLLPLLLLGGLVFSMPLQLAAQVPIDDNGEPCYRRAVALNHPVLAK